MENSKQQPVQSMPKTPNSGGKDKNGDGEEKEKDIDKEKKAEAARAATKKQQEADMPRFDKGENEIFTSTDCYEVVTELGQGSFGAVYGVIRKSDKQSFALKCESCHLKKSMLPHEANVLLALNLLKSPHFVEMIDYGTVGDRFLFVIMKCVGKNLWDIRMTLPDRRYTLKTVLRIAEQTLEGLRDLHRVGYLHRDIKPPNFAIGRDASDMHTIYLLDFGLCRRIVEKGKDLRTPRRECAFRGTTRYASLAAHDNVEFVVFVAFVVPNFQKDQSRKDDIESWWYMIAEMIIIEIPWKQKKGTDRDGVRADKQRLRDSDDYFKFLFRKCCYEQMAAILKYLDSLTYTSIPDYDYVYHNITAIAVVNKIQPSDPPDWDPDAKRYKGPVYREKQPYIVKELE
ncbi:Protein CBG09188 [Caenorhabditis briggsae]|uniref:Protein CBG09188 n=1 Tax=Caenorhabditis briggsae TaxID=6238 RepID=A8X896_CAEBR|nr:Protein CBG09188 [Caenorhabditis briggsae]CAP28857.2 Protein CBG09188 [Caenorhabditis briggsae]